MPRFCCCEDGDLFVPAIYVHDDPAIAQSLACQLTLRFAKDGASLPAGWENAPSLTENVATFSIAWILTIPTYTNYDNVTIMRHQATADGWTVAISTIGVRPGETTSAVGKSGGWTNQRYLYDFCIGFEYLTTLFIVDIVIEGDDGTTWTWTATDYGVGDTANETGYADTKTWAAFGVGSEMTQTGGPQLTPVSAEPNASFLSFTSAESCDVDPRAAADSESLTRFGSWVWRYHPFILAPAVDPIPQWTHMINNFTDLGVAGRPECCSGASSSVYSIPPDDWVPDFGEFKTVFDFTIQADPGYVTTVGFDCGNPFKGYFVANACDDVGNPDAFVWTNDGMFSPPTNNGTFRVNPVYILDQSSNDLKSVSTFHFNFPFGFPKNYSNLFSNVTFVYCTSSYIGGDASIAAVRVVLVPITVKPINSLPSNADAAIELPSVQCGEYSGETQIV